MKEKTELIDFVSDFIDSNSEEFSIEINQFLYNNPETNYEVCHGYGIVNGFIQIDN